MDFLTNADIAAQVKADIVAEELDERNREARKAVWPEIVRMNRLIEALEMRIAEMETSIAMMAELVTPEPDASCGYVLTELPPSYETEDK